jgi:hypothetical protein
LAAAGVALLVVWGIWWASSLQHHKLRLGRHTWVEAYSFLGLDFLHNYRASRHWLAGGDPYREPFGDPLARKLCYPPMVLPQFAWCGWFSPKDATGLWLAALTLMAALGAWAAWRTRRELGLWDVSLPFALAAILWCTPVVFALERGNYDLVVLLLLVPAAWALRERSWVRDGVAGACLALATVLKVYPGFLVLGLLPLRRLRALACCILAGLALGLVGFEYLPAFRHNLNEFIAQVSEQYSKAIHVNGHTLTTYWKPFWEGVSFRRLRWLAGVRGSVAALGLILPLAGWVSYRMYRCSSNARLLFPYFAWLAAAATFLPKVSNDYNLVFLPLAVLAVWDRRDPVWVHVVMAFFLVWWQPLALPVGPHLLLVCKYLGLVAAGVCLVRRAQEQGQAAGVEQRPEAGTAPLLRAAA